MDKKKEKRNGPGGHPPPPPRPATIRELALSIDTCNTATA